CGEVANQTHIPIWRGIKDIKIVAVCDKNEKTAKKTANRVKINRYFTELPSMLNDTHIDIVDNCTPVWLHAQTSIQALEHGCHVLVEKPMALRLEEANKLIQVSNRKGVKLGVIHNSLFNPAVVKAMALVHDKRLGDLIGVDIKYFKRRDDDWVLNKNHWSHKLPGGMFGEILAHPIYLARAFLGDLNVVAVHIRKFGGCQWIKADELRVMVDGEKGRA
ncbi:MAG: Gfo/Idh/MocA family protein, partial [Candidatus Hodarchaeota archaeon]